VAAVVGLASSPGRYMQLIGRVGRFSKIGMSVALVTKDEADGSHHKLFSISWMLNNKNRAQTIKHTNFSDQEIRKWRWVASPNKYVIIIINVMIFYYQNIPTSPTRRSGSGGGWRLPDLVNRRSGTRDSPNRGDLTGERMITSHAR
jgi:superfamily II DNA/RNA helicase